MQTDLTRSVAKVGQSNWPYKAVKLENEKQPSGIACCVRAGYGYKVYQCGGLEYFLKRDMKTLMDFKF